MGKKSKILILNTGGTMGMKPREDGSLTPEPGYLSERIRAMPEVDNPKMPIYDIKEYDPLIDSSDMNTENWVSIAQDIERAYYDYDGFLVIHGTDTLSYTASALSFMMENLGKPIIFTGSMVPFRDVWTDARMNLITSMLIAANTDIPEVCIFFNSKLLRANRSIKISNSRMDAFDSPNFSVLGTVGTSVFLRYDLILPQPKGRFRLHKELDTHIIFQRMVPGFDDEAIELIAEHSTDIKALILELYGSGNAPTNKKRFLDALKKLSDRGVVLVATTQCLHGSVDLGAYAVAQCLKDIGVVSAKNMTPSCVAAKLSYLFGKGLSANDVKTMIPIALRGELDEKMEDQFHMKFSRL